LSPVSAELSDRSSTRVQQDDPSAGSASLPLRFSKRQAIALAFPPLPDYLVDSCRQLSVGNLTPHQRANRAWLAGCWAKAVLEEQVDRPDPSEPLDVSSRYYCVLRADGVPSPVVCASLAAFRRVIGPDLGRSVMDFAQLVAYESGSLEVLEFSWPPTAEEERDLGQQPAEDSGIGPSIVVSASPVMLTSEGTWVAASDQERLSALVVDMADHLAEQLAPADLAVEELVCFRQGQPMLFPLASEVLRQSKEWLLGAENFPEDRSGYHTAVSATEAPAQRPKPPKPKRPTVQQLAAQQSQMMQLMTSVVERLDSLQVSASRAPGPTGQAAPAPPAAVNTAILQKPLASALPPVSAAPRSLAQAIGADIVYAVSGEALDLLAAGSEAGARDTLSLLLLMMEQTALDGGNSSLAWLLTLQAEPPQSLFQTPAQAKGPGIPKAPSKPVPPPPTPPNTGDLTKKQQRAAAWAARKASAETVGEAVFLGWCPWTLDFFCLGSSPGLPFAPVDVPCASNASGDVFPLHGSSLREEGEFAFESWIAALPRLSEVVCFVERCGLTPGAYPGDGALPEEAPFLPHADHGLEALHPYRDLRADQVALHGEGKWDLAVHLGPDLYMPYVEPQVLHFAGLDAPFPSFAKEKPDHLIEICKLWDASALLGFVPGPLPDRQLTRLFGAYKAPGKLRQIGDRRGQNASEAHLCGPSRFLPSGPLLCRIHVPAGHCLVGSVTDRQDFYTQ
ncbi:unnamed protein product, partial [Symbiodinium necroappetens]